MGHQFGCDRAFIRHGLHGLGRAAQLPQQLLFQLLHLLPAWVSPSPPQPVEPAHQVAAGVVLAQWIPFAEQHRQAAAQLLGPQLPRPQQQLCQAGMQSQLREPASVRRERARGIHRVQLLQQPLPLEQMGLRWGFQPRQRTAQASAPLRQLQHQRCGIGLQHGWRIKGRPALLLRGAPQAQGPARSESAGAAGALLRTGLAGGQRDQGFHAAAWIEAAPAAQAAVDHQGDALDRE